MPSGSRSCTWYGNLYFGHWLHDDLLLTLAAGALAPPVQIDRRPYLHERGYAEALGIESRTVNPARFDELFVIEDSGRNAHRRRRYQIIRARVEQRAARPPRRRRVFIRRGRTGVSRDLANEAEVEALLTRHGFATIEPEGLSAAAIIDALRGADIIAAVEGSHLYHSCYTIREGGTLLVLQPPFRFVSNLKIEMESIGAHFAFVVGVPNPGPGGSAADAASFDIPLDDLSRTLDLVDRETRGS
jgi:hypothetical protein